MIQVLQQIFDKALDRMSQQLTTFVPPLLVAFVILLVAFLLARLFQWITLKAVKGLAIDRFLRESGLSSTFDPSGRMRAAPLLAGFVFWAVLATGICTAIDVFDTKLTSQIVENSIFLLPKLLTAGAIVVAGFWLAQYLSRSLVVWAVNEGIPFARRLAGLAKVAMCFFAVVVAAELLGFAGHVFYAAFVIFFGAVALAVGLGVGFAVKDKVQRYLSPPEEAAGAREEKSLWDHL